MTHPKPRRYYVLYGLVACVVAIKAVSTIYSASMVLLAHARMQGLRNQESTLVKHQQELEQQVATAHSLSSLSTATLSQYQPIKKTIAILDANLNNSTAQLPTGSVSTTP